MALQIRLIGEQQVMAQPQRLFTPQESHRLQIKQLESKQPFTESDRSRPAFF